MKTTQKQLLQKANEFCGDVLEPMARAYTGGDCVEIEFSSSCYAIFYPDGRWQMLVSDSFSNLVPDDLPRFARFAGACDQLAAWMAERMNPTKKKTTSG